MNSRQERIEFLSRQNRRRILLPKFVAALSHLLGEAVELRAVSTIPETDMFADSFRRAYTKVAEGASAGYRKFFQSTDRRSVLRVVDCLAHVLSSESVILLTKSNGEAIALRLPRATLFGHAASLLRLDGDSLSVLSNDQTQGIMVDFNQDESDETYEVVVWGDQWVEELSRCGESGL